MNDILDGLMFMLFVLGISAVCFCIGFTVTVLLGRR